MKALHLLANIPAIVERAKSLEVIMYLTNIMARKSKWPAHLTQRLDSKE